MPGLESIDWAALAQARLDLARQEAADRHLGVTADANLRNTQAGVLPAESKANIGLTNANAGKAVADTGLVNLTAKYFPQVTTANIGLTNAEALNQRSSAGVNNAQAAATRTGNRLGGIDLSSLGSSYPGGFNPDALGSRLDRLYSSPFGWLKQ